MSDEDVKPWERPIVSAEEFKRSNEELIAEFRANGGKVGGDYEGAKLLLLTTTGSRSGKPHTVALAYQADGDCPVITSLVESAYPHWYTNLLANPNVTVESGTETFAAIAAVATGAERERLWSWMNDAAPWLAEHQQTTVLEMPLVILRRQRG